jgi:chromate transporter
LYPLLGKREIGPDAAPKLSLPALLLQFLRIGAIGFGGGMAVIAFMERDLIQKRRVLEPEEFLHGVGLGQILGPFGVNAALFIGNRLYGTLGGLACAFAFMVPSVVLVILLSWLYFSFHALPSLQKAMVGLSPVVIALIISAAWSMGRKAIRSWPAVLLASLTLGFSLLKINAVYVLLAAGLTGLLAGKGISKGSWHRKPPDRNKTPMPGPGPSTNAAMVLFPATGAMAGGMSLTFLGWTFLKIGCIFFGGGFVLVPILHQKLVETLGWLTPREFLDGVAISNLTPGPISVLATFAGFHVYGVSGALVATIALFTPSLILMTILSHGYGRLKNEPRFQNFMAGVTPAVVGLVVSASVLLAPGAFHGIAGWGLSVVALLILIRFQWHPAWVLAIGAILGIVGIVR